MFEQELLHTVDAAQMYSQPGISSAGRIHETLGTADRVGSVSVLTTE